MHSAVVQSLAIHMYTHTLLPPGKAACCVGVQGGAQVPTLQQPQSMSEGNVCDMACSASVQMSDRTAEQHERTIRVGLPPDLEMSFLTSMSSATSSMLLLCTQAP